VGANCNVEVQRVPLPLQQHESSDVRGHQGCRTRSVAHEIWTLQVEGKTEAVANDSNDIRATVTDPERGIVVLVHTD